MNISKQSAILERITNYNHNEWANSMIKAVGEIEVKRLLSNPPKQVIVSIANELYESYEGLVSMEIVVQLAIKNFVALDLATTKKEWC